MALDNVNNSAKEAANTDSVANSMLSEAHESMGMPSTDQRMANSSKQSSLDIDKESSKIADLMKLDFRFFGKTADSLSRDLGQLSGNDYNKLLKQVQEKSLPYSEAHPDAGRLLLQNWDEKTGTWDKVTMTRGSGQTLPEDVRFVQPGNTLAEIATDKLNESGMQFGPKEVKLMANELANENHIYDPENLQVGKALHYPYPGIFHERESLQTGDVLVQPADKAHSFDSKELIMPNGEYLQSTGGMHVFGLNWSLHAADGTTIIDTLWPGKQPQSGDTCLSDGSTLHSGKNQWTIEYPNKDKITLTKQLDATQADEALNISVYRGGQTSSFSVKA